MGYTEKQWRHRVSQRTDLSSYVTHLTRETTTETPVEVLFKILEEGVIKGSTTESGFIVGDVPAVCFQEAPLSGICQNVYFEQLYRQEAIEKAKKKGSKINPKVRYKAVGLMFSKPYVYKAGGRPVIYDDRDSAKSYLDKSQWWRIVRFDLSKSTNFVDWTHEREWRVPNDFRFDVSEATILVTKKSSYASLVRECKNRRSDLLERVAGVVVMENILY